MRKIILLSSLILIGLGLSQALPRLIPGEFLGHFELVVRALTMTGLAFIMIHVGFEFHIDKRRLGSYGWDYLVAFTAATFPWVFVTLYFLLVMLPAGSASGTDAWKETLLAGRFAAPTSAGVLFTMLAAAGLAGTWLFSKARVLAIFDDLDTVLLMIPLKMLMVGLAWQLGVIGLLMIGLVGIAYVFMHRVAMPVTWPWVLGYAALITLGSESVYGLTKTLTPEVPIHIEVLMPAFALGCIARPPVGSTDRAADAGHAHHQLHAVLNRPSELTAAAVISSLFMFLVGLSMPPLLAVTADAQTITGAQPAMSPSQIAWHVLVVTVLSNLGKMFPALCYRREAPWRERLALAIGMWPRGEVGAGVLVVSMSYGIGGPVLTVAMLSLALNLILTGVFVTTVRRLIGPNPTPASDPHPHA